MNPDTIATNLLRAFAFVGLVGCSLLGLYLLAVGASAPFLQGYPGALGLVVILSGLFSFAVLTALASIVESLIAIRQKILPNEDKSAPAK